MFDIHCILNDQQIAALATDAGMIDPFVPEKVTYYDGAMHRRRVISLGLGHYGYDMTLGEDVKVFTPNVCSGPIDPKNFDERLFQLLPIICEDERCAERHVVLPPHSFSLGHSVETIRMPNNTFAFCLGKSTYARCGMVVGMTPLEPGWDGQITFELANTTPLPMKVYLNEGICQVVFFKGKPPEKTYTGKYQGQKGVTPPCS